MKFFVQFLSVAAICLAPAFVSAQTVRMVDQSKNAGKVEWLPRQIQMGNIPLDVPAKGEFEVKNISTEPLVLLEVSPTCHCTVVDFPKDPILPGESAKIVAVYDAKRPGDFYKIITVQTNFDAEQTVALSMTGKVVKQ